MIGNQARPRRLVRGLLPLSCLFALACEPPPAPVVPPPAPFAAPVATASQPAAIPEDPPPRGKLPADVRPHAYTVAMTLVPERPAFEGTVDIDLSLDAPRSVIWLHARALRVREATITPQANGAAAMPVRFEQVTDDGVAAVRAPRPIPAGRATLHLVFEGDYHHSDTGLHSAKVGGNSYAFTQFEATHAREAFPCFDEPRFKTPYTMTVTVPSGQVAIANTREIGREETKDGLVRVRFAPTEPLPSYLVAWAAGPFDVVDAPAIPPNDARKRPLPLRGVAVKGRGKELAYALAHTGEILDVLEREIGIGYPYDKLDVIAVPDKGGAMENPGAVTFREWLLLVDDQKATVAQKRAFAGVMAHELAHQWFGDYVTMPWWDDIWLNEAFATWMGGRATQAWRADTQAEVHQLERVMDAMGTDGLVSARRIRQPIDTTHDISNAFDDITYRKGGGVIAMFERFLGRDVWRRGIHDYLEKHRMGLATADDLMASLSAAAGRDVGKAFRTFLDQPGVPLVEAKVTCDGAPRLLLSQSRYFPLGSKGDPAVTWQIPVCARYQVGAEAKETCTLLTEKTGELPLAGCPEWLHPNAAAAGYYRFVLPPADLDKLQKKGFAKLSTQERMALASSLRVGFSRGTSKAGDVYAALAPFALDAHPLVADEPMGLLRTATDWLHGDALAPKVQAYGRSLYAKTAKGLGWERAAKDASPEQAILRQRVLSFLVTTARDPAMRREALKRGQAVLAAKPGEPLRTEGIDPELVGLALAVVMEDADAALFDAVLARFAATDDEVTRGWLLGALAAARKPELAARARDLALDPRVRVSETLWTIWGQLEDHRTREATWAWVKTNIDAVIAKVTPARGGFLPWLGGSFCDEAHIADAEALFRTRADKLDGGPRVLASMLESGRLCVAKRGAQEPHVRAFFAK